MKLRLPVLAALALLAAAAAHAAPTTPVRELLLSARDPDDLRARLAAHAESVSADPLDAGEAWFHLGRSWARAPHPDRALAAFARARAARGNVEERFAAIDIWLARHEGADLDSAASWLAFLLEQPLGVGADEVRLREAWLRGLRGDGSLLPSLLDARRSPLLRPRGTVAHRERWAGRLAPLALAAGDGDGAWRLVSPLAVATRDRDESLSRLARTASVGRPIGTDYDRWMQLASARADTAELAAIVGLGAKPLAVRAEDGAVLHAWFVPGPRGAPVAVVAAPAESEAAAACDSLVVQLRRAGLAVALLEPRGVRRSASASEPAALLREGGEEAALRRLARDLGHALTASAKAGGGTPRGVFVGIGPTAIAAVLAAESDARARAVLLSGPEIAPEERGWLCASLAASGVPAFIETGPEGALENLVVDRIVAMLPPTQTRVADARWPGYGAALFRAGPAEGKRFAGWLSGVLKQPRATPPPPPR